MKYEKQLIIQGVGPLMDDPGRASVRPLYSCLDNIFSLALYLCVTMKSFREYQAPLSIMAIIISFLTTGCATLAEKEKNELFDTRASAYEQALYLGNYHVAEDFIRKQPGAELKSDRDRLMKFKITSYETLRVRISPDESVVNQSVEIKYYHIDYLLEKTLTDEQLWKYYPEEKTWYLETGLPHLTK